jgi:monoamine oxidase
MARSPFMRWLATFTREHADAARAGIPVDELRSRPPALTRRRFITSAVAGFGVAACGRLAPRRTFDGPVAIVGGGIAGLTAALTLAKAGVPFMVYEAAARLGGRMHSEAPEYWDDAQRTEWCGELIDGNHDTLLGLAREFELPLTDLHAAHGAGAMPAQFAAGSPYTRERADADFAPVREALARDLRGVGSSTTYADSTPAAVRLDRMSVREWIDTRVPDGTRSPFGALLDTAIASDYGADTADLSAMNISWLLGIPALGVASQRQFRIAGGNARLPLAIAARLPAGSVAMEWRLDALAHRSDGRAVLTFATPGGTREVAAAHVILALPFAVLRSVGLDRAGFDPLKRHTIDALGRARNAKLHLQFRRRFWTAARGTGSSLADLGYQTTYEVSRGQGGASGLLVNYRGAAVADRVRPSAPYAYGGDALAAEARWLVEQLERVWPGAAREWNGKVSLSAPALDPNLGCSYAYWRVGQFHTLRGYERVRQGNVHFAGEHCSVEFQGYMEGGAQEGIRASNDVIGRL